MHTNVKLTATAAAVLLVVVGCQSTSGNAGSGGQPTTASSPGATLASSSPPAAAASPSTTSSARAVFPSWYTDGGNGAGILPAGGQTTTSFVPRFTFTVPDGWVNESDEVGVFGLFPDTPANQAAFASSGNLDNALFLGPLDSPYFVCKAWEDNRGATAAEMVAKVVANDASA